MGAAPETKRARAWIHYKWFPPSYLPLRILNGHFKNQPIVIYGSGPSINTAKDSNLKYNLFSISVNHAQNVIPSPVNLYQDADYLRQNLNRLNNQRVLGFNVLPNTKHILQRPKFRELPTFYCWRLINHHHTHQPVPDYLDAAWMKLPVFFSGFIAINIARILGFSPIILVGFDLNPTTYSYGNPHPVHKSSNKIALRSAENHYNYLKEHHQKFNIINCSQSDWADTEPFESTIEKYKPNSSVCTEYLNTVYTSNVEPHISQAYLKAYPKYKSI